MQRITFDELQPQIVLGIAAHPDDLDFSAGGSLSKFVNAGATLYYLQLTDGGKGSDDPAMTPAKLQHIRQKEQEAACAILGGKGVTFLNHPDGGLEVTMDLKREIVATIRRLKPDVVITTDPTMIFDSTRGIINHPDHRAAGQATLDAVYPLARDRLSFPELAQTGLEPHKVRTVLMTSTSDANFYIDITDNLSVKMQAASAHASQIHDIPAFKTMLTEHAAELGTEAGYQFAEGFKRIDVYPR